MTNCKRQTANNKMKKSLYAFAVFAVILIAAAIFPAAAVSGESDTTGYDWYIVPTKDHTQPRPTEEAAFLKNDPALFV